MKIHHVTILLAPIMCISSSGLANTTPPIVAEAVTQKALPCDVVSHGMGAVLSSMTGRSSEANCDNENDFSKENIDKLIAVVAGEHPAHYYVLASRLFSSGRKDDAVFWFYAGQLRYRIRLVCHPDLPRDVEPALFGSLQSSVGQELNEYAGGNAEKWAGTMERALRWDLETPNGFEPKSACKAAIKEQREGMQGLIGHVRSSADELRTLRKKNGLPNSN